MVLYFETSALNWFIKNKSIEDLVATRKLQTTKRKRWCLSCVTLWELFLTTKEEERYKIINSARFLFDPYLTPTPEELIVNFIKAGCPNVEKKYEFISYGILSKEWTRSCKETSYLLHPSEKDLLLRTKTWRHIGKVIQTYDTDALKIISHVTGSVLNEIYVQNLFENLVKRSNIKYYTKSEEILLKKTILCSLVILCFGFLFDRQAIDAYWNSLKIHDTNNRIHYLIENHPDLFKRGPLHNIAKMFTVQKEKSNRGLIFDTLHSVYIDYVDLFITNDQHYKYIEKNFEDVNTNKIKLVDELIWQSPAQIIVTKQRD
jgi:hypothetical protein